MSYRASKGEVAAPPSPSTALTFVEIIESLGHLPGNAPREPRTHVLPFEAMAVSAHVHASSILDHHEIDLVDRALFLIAAHAPVDADILRELIIDLRQMAAQIERQRPLRAPTALGGEARDEQSLISHLCQLDGLSGDLELPLKATLSRTYLLTKINFLRGFVKATAALGQRAPECGPICRELREELAQSIYTLLAEELLLALLRKPGVAKPTKRSAADQLISIWDDAALEIDDFAPMLESAWHARNRVNAAYGTLLGTTETVRLACEDCSPYVLDFFGREGRCAEESQAFEEFLFNMTFEELQKLRGEMSAQAVRCANPTWAAQVLGRQIEELEHSQEIDPMALYRSYQRRQLAADFRLMAGTPGPRRTAEAYLMVHLLEQHSAQ